MRTWTAADGRTLDAELVSVDEEGVTVRRKTDGRTMSLTLAMLSEDDQDYVKSLQVSEAQDAALEEDKLTRSKGLKSGPYKDLITGEFMQSKSEEGMPFQLFGPEDLRSKERYPLVVALHGGSGRGGDEPWPPGEAANVYSRGEFAEANPCFVVAPRCAIDASWNGPQGDMVAALVKSLSKHLPIDINRIYVTGGSMGGGGTWYQITEHQSLYAGAIVLGNAGHTKDVEKTKDFPIWQFHGELDEHPVEKARAMAEAQKEAGSTGYKFTELVGEGHVVHKPVYKSGEALIWLFEQKRGAEE
ncbi:MAG: hypothetical protein ACSHYB_12515 [Roseibacillus sp.]